MFILNLFAATVANSATTANPLAPSSVSPTIDAVLASGKPARMAASDIDVVNSELQAKGLRGGALATPQQIVDAVKAQPIGTEVLFEGAVAVDGFELRKARSGNTLFSSFDFEANINGVGIPGKMLAPNGVKASQLVVGQRFQIAATQQADGRVFMAAKFN